MKALYRAIACLLVIFTLPSAMAATPNTYAAPSAHNFGLGIVIGEPSALTGKAWLSHEAAVDFGLSFSFDDYILLYADYLFHFPDAFGRSSAFVSQLTPYIGVGGIIAFANDRFRVRDRKYFGTSANSVALGLRIPLGIEWTPARVPLGVFVELVPGLSIVPDTQGFVQGGIGVRYYF